MSHDIVRDAREDEADAWKWRHRPNPNENALRDHGARLFIADRNSPIVSAFIEGARHILAQIER